MSTADDPQEAVAADGDEVMESYTNGGNDHRESSEPDSTDTPPIAESDVDIPVLPRGRPPLKPKKLTYAQKKAKAEAAAEAMRVKVSARKQALKLKPSTRGKIHLRRITFVSGDPNKLDGFKLIMGEDFPIPIETRQLDLFEQQCATAEKVAREKCRDACRVLQPLADEAILCEGTSLCFNALNGFPGPYVKWFMQLNDGPEALSRMAEGLDDPSAYAQTIFTFYGPEPKPKNPHRVPFTSKNELPTTTRGCCDKCRTKNFNDADRFFRLFAGTCDGNIVEPRGEHAFGWDPCFEPTVDGEHEHVKHGDVRKTFAEMTGEEKNSCSQRARALEKLKEFLDHHYYYKK